MVIDHRFTHIKKKSTLAENGLSAFAIYWHNALFLPPTPKHAIVWGNVGAP